MIFANNVYIIYVDGIFIGVAEKEDYAWDVVNDAINGFSKPLYDDDIPDRVEIVKINVNRWYIYNAHNCSDKLSDNNIMCYSCTATKECMNILNELNLEKERLEAKLRAMAL